MLLSFVSTNVPGSVRAGMRRMPFCTLQHEWPGGRNAAGHLAVVAQRRSSLLYTHGPGIIEVQAKDHALASTTENMSRLFEGNASHVQACQKRTPGRCAKGLVFNETEKSWPSYLPDKIRRAKTRCRA